MKASDDDLDAIFGALADPTRRAILMRLSRGEAAVNELAAPFAMSQPAVSRHIKVLEHAGLVERSVDRQRRPARINARRAAMAARWIEEFTRQWSGRFDRLDGLLGALKDAEREKLVR
jgi:DNA-binding transcriptional ArsR family regulator